MPPVSPAPSPGSSDRKVLIFVGSVVGLIGILIFVWIWAANATPTVPPFPTPTLPANNAYKLYVEAGSLLARTNEIDEAVSGAPKRRFPVVEKEALLRANGNTLHMLHRGLSLPYQEPAQVRSADWQFPNYARLREMARLLALEGKVYRERGRLNDAPQSCLDAVRLGQQIPRGGPLIARLVGIACQAIGRRPLWDMQDDLSAATAKAAARRLEAIATDKVPYAETLEEEKYWGQAILLETFRNPAKVAGSSLDGGEEDSGAAPTPAAMQIVYLLYSKRQILRSYTEYLDRLIAESKEPFAAHPNPPPLPPDPLNQSLLPVFHSVRVKDTENDAQNALLRTALALRAYRVEHGRYPDRLDALAPAYLAQTPRDPYTLNAPLRYRRTGDRYVLYSVGPDGKDDGGKPVDNPKETGNKRRFVNADSRGDVVAGVNYF